MISFYNFNGVKQEENAIYDLLTDDKEILTQ